MAAREYKRYRYVYTDGSAAPRLEPVPRRTPEQIRREQLRRQRAIEERRRRERTQVRQNQRRETLMNPGYVLFLAVAIVTVSIFCGLFLQKQSALVEQRESVYALQQELSELQRSNDILEHDIMTAANLNQIRESAEDLGMDYPDAGQIVYYSVDNDLYGAESGIYAR